MHYKNMTHRCSFFYLNPYFFIMQSVIYLLTSIISLNCSYWCLYGYQDKRNNPPPPKRKRYFIQNSGYQFHFLVNVYEHNPDVSFITYNSFKYVDSKGTPCHGVNEPSNNFRSMLAPYFSSKIISMIEVLLSIGMPIDQMNEGQYLNELFDEL